MRRSLALTAAALLALALAGELCIRSVQRAPFLGSAADFADAELGWKEATRSWGTGPRRLLIIGDSYTDSYGVPEAKSYPALLAQSLGAEVFTVSGGGYGTLQETLALERHFDEIRPDLVVLQVCYNDFVNNSWELEAASYFNNNLMSRPYWEDGRVVHRFPSRGGRLRVFLTDHSRLAYDVLSRVDQSLSTLSWKGWLRSSEHEVEAQGPSYPPFRRAVAATSSIVAKLKARTGKTPLVAFSVDSVEPYASGFREVFRENGVEYIEDAGRAVAKQEAAGTWLRLGDLVHWNEQGHALCAELLAASLRGRS
jgi:lysophospholipase L1-like esterase